MRGTTLIAGAVAGMLLAAGAYAAQTLQLPPGPNRDLVYGQCQTCHDLQYLIESAGVPRNAWSDLLDSMKQYGLRLSPEQRGKILDYLALYLGPNPPPKSAAAPAAPATADGATVFKDQCVACHQANALGVPGQFPPLAGNRDLFLSRDYPVRVLLFGLSGKIEVNGKTFNSAMPPLGEVLNDAQIAAVVNYVRGNFGNAALAPKTMPAVDAGLVAQLRAQKPPVSAYDIRKQLKSKPR